MTSKSTEREWMPRYRTDEEIMELCEKEIDKKNRELAKTNQTLSEDYKRGMRESYLPAYKEAFNIAVAKGEQVVGLMMQAWRDVVKAHPATLHADGTAGTGAEGRAMGMAYAEASMKIAAENGLSFEHGYRLSQEAMRRNNEERAGGNAN